MNCISEREEVFRFILSSQFPRLVSRHALVIFHQIIHFLKGVSSPRTILCACLLQAMKVHNRTSTSLLKSLYQHCESKKFVVPLHLCIVQLIRTKVVLIESCLRINLRQLIVCNPGLFRARKYIVRVALTLTDKIYRTKYCLYPSSAAAAALLQSCILLELEVPNFPWKNDSEINEILSNAFS